MGKIIRNVLISAAGVVVFVGAGFAIGSTGFRWNQFAREGFWGFTSHQWGILASGSVGAALALIGVAITLTWQRKQFFEEQRLSDQRAIEARYHAAVNGMRIELGKVTGIILAGDPIDRSAEASYNASELRVYSAVFSELGDDALSLAAIDLAFVGPALADGSVSPHVDKHAYEKVKKALYDIDVCLTYWNVEDGGRRDGFRLAIRADIRTLADVAREKGARLFLSTDSEHYETPTPDMI